MTRQRNTNGLTFESLETRRLLTVLVTDLDLDGDRDVVASGQVGWFENVDGQFEHRDSETPGEYGGILADIDGDGSDDVVTHTSWYEFKDGAFLKHPFADETQRLHYLKAIDVHADGDLDIVARSDTGIVFAENRDNRLLPSVKVDHPEFGAPHNVTPFDFDLDGDLDFLVLALAREHGDFNVNLSWYLNEGDGNYGKQTISEYATHPSYLSTNELIDIDGDGDLDLFEVATSDLIGFSYTSWRENVGNDQPWPRHAIKSRTEYDIRDPSVWKMHDSDRDGDLDAVLWDGSQLENTGDGFVPCCQIQMVGLELYGERGGFGDINDDGVIDRIAIREQELSWYDGSVISDEGQIAKVVESMGMPYSASNVDVAGGGTVDEVDYRHLVEEVLEYPWGDSNFDHVFDTKDMVLAFQAGEYNDGISNNSTWAEGDWNGDGDFDSSDLVRVFQAGGYGQLQRIAGDSVVGSSPDFEDVSVLFDDDLETRIYFSREGADQTFTIRFDFDRTYDVQEIRLRHGLGEVFLPFSFATPILEPIEVNYYSSSGETIQGQTLAPDNRRWNNILWEQTYESFALDPVFDVASIELQIEGCEELVFCRWPTGLHDVMFIGRNSDG